MKRTKVIALVLCAAVMLLGAGYAYWTDTLTITNTVSTGELNVEFLNTYVTDNDNYANATWATADAEDEVNNITIVATNLYPGAKFGFATTVKNTGTIPVELNSIQFTKPADESIAGKTLLSVSEYNHFKVSGTINYRGTNYTVPSGITLKTINDVLEVLKNIPTMPNNAYNRIEPNETITFNLELTLDTGLLNNDLENSYLKTIMVFNFRQYNAQ